MYFLCCEFLVQKEVSHLVLNSYSDKMIRGDAAKEFTGYDKKKEKRYQIS